VGWVYIATSLIPTPSGNEKNPNYSSTPLALTRWTILVKLQKNPAGKRRRVALLWSAYTFCSNGWHQGLVLCSCTRQVDCSIYGSFGKYTLISLGFVYGYWCLTKVLQHAGSWRCYEPDTFFFFPGSVHDGHQWRCVPSHPHINSDQYRDLNKYSLYLNHYIYYRFYLYWNWFGDVLLRICQDYSHRVGGLVPSVTTSPLSQQAQTLCEEFVQRQPGMILNSVPCGGGIYPFSRRRRPRREWL